MEGRRERLLRASDEPERRPPFEKEVEPKSSPRQYECTLLAQSVTSSAESRSEIVSGVTSLRVMIPTCRPRTRNDVSGAPGALGSGHAVYFAPEADEARVEVDDGDVPHADLVEEAVDAVERHHHAHLAARAARSGGRWCTEHGMHQKRAAVFHSDAHGKGRGIVEGAQVHGAV